MSKISEKEKFHKKFKRKYIWRLTMIVLFALLIASVFTGGFKDFFEPSAIGSQEAATNAVDYINSAILGEAATAKLKGVTASEVDFLYKFNIEIDGRTYPSYVTKDGKYLIPQELIDITEKRQVVTTPTTGASTSTDIPKTDKPIAQAFVFSYCPYGLQFQKALLPVYNLLKNKANIELVAIGAMHGEYEKQESLRQVCIEEEYSKDKLWEYLNKFMINTKIGSCRGDTKCSDPLIAQIMAQLDIDKNTINDCMVTNAESLYTSQNNQARKLGISGSPTFVLNGEKIQLSRSPEAIKEAICSAFKNPPVECQQTLLTAQASPGFGSGTSSRSGSC